MSVWFQIGNYINRQFGENRFQIPQENQAKSGAEISWISFHSQYNQFQYLSLFHLFGST